MVLFLCAAAIVGAYFGGQSTRQSEEEIAARIDVVRKLEVKRAQSALKEQKRVLGERFDNRLRSETSKAYRQGRSDGQTEGYRAGSSDGYERGSNEGYRRGAVDGFKTGTCYTPDDFRYVC